MDKLKYDLVYYNDKRLETEADDITEFNSELKSIAEQMYIANKIYDGIAIAGNQLGIMKKIVALTPIAPFNKNICLINPKIISYSDETTVFEEGCLSFPNLFIKVTRPKKVVVEYQMLSGKKYQIEADGILARVLQHEIDHLYGTTFIKRLDSKTFKKVEKKLAKIDKEFNK